jgi:curved DNA-binding protein CbpA
MLNSGVPVTLAQAYRILDVPPDSSALAIKQAYRKLLRRWHPDLQKSGTAAQAESTEMARRINEAYALIEHAPLRYARFTRANSESPQTKQAGNTEWQEYMVAQALRRDRNAAPHMDRVEFWVRFVCGAILGCFIAFLLSIDLLGYPFSQKAYPDSVTIPAFVLIVVACAYGSARLGDHFWYSMFGWRKWL